jgi:hypothetical protein
LKKILHPPSSPEAIQRCHDADQCTKWFGKTVSQHAPIPADTTCRHLS